MLLFYGAWDNEQFLLGLGAFFLILLYDDQVPLTYVIDREIALMNTIEIVFPRITHILCWGILLA